MWPDVNTAFGQQFCTPLNFYSDIILTRLGENLIHPKIQLFPGKLNGLNELISEMDPNRGAMSTQHNPLEYHAIQKRLKI